LLEGRTGSPESREAGGVRLNSRWTPQVSLTSPGASPLLGQQPEAAWEDVTGTPAAFAAKRTLRVDNIYGPTFMVFIPFLGSEAFNFLKSIILFKFQGFSSDQYNSKHLCRSYVYTISQGEVMLIQRYSVSLSKNG